MIKRDILNKITEKFNNDRKPECLARVLFNKDAELKVEFTGTAVFSSCCFDEHFKDYSYYLKDLANLDFEISDIKRPKPDKFVVTYKKVK